MENSTNKGFDEIAKLKSREEYLVEFEKRCLEGLKDSHQSICRNLFIAYVLVSLFFIIPLNKIIKINFWGINFEMEGNDFLFYVSICIIFEYLIISLQIANVGPLINELFNNSRDINQINPQAKPIKLNDLFVFGGLLLRLPLTTGKTLFIKESSEFKSKNILVKIYTYIMLFLFNIAIFSLPIIIIYYKMWGYYYLSMGIFIVMFILFLTYISEILSFSNTSINDWEGKINENNHTPDRKEK